jgi:hypothetical protein
VQREAVLLHPQPDNPHHSPCIVLSLETDDEVVGIADQERFAPEPRPDLFLEPQVEHVVQIDVSEQR